MKILKEIISLSQEYLKSKDVLRPRYSAEVIVSHVLHCKRLDIYLDLEKPLVEEEITSIRNLVKRRGLKEPLEYILGSLDFYNCNLKITNDVLIPRVETEELVSLVVNEIEKDSLQGKNLFDICTGSGCIAIALKKKFSNLNVFASDISLKALEVAKKNGEMNEVEIDFLHGNLLTPYKKKADFVICNPPYVSEVEYENLSFEVKGFEPKISLLAKEEGLEFYKILAKELPSYLNPRAKIFFEIGHLQGQRVKEIFSDRIWISKKVYKDLSQKDRFFFLEIE
jgi:release factor glutamine methyltransferase